MKSIISGFLFVSVFWVSPGLAAVSDGVNCFNRLVYKLATRPVQGQGAKGLNSDITAAVELDILGGLVNELKHPGREAALEIATSLGFIHPTNGFGPGSVFEAYDQFIKNNNINLSLKPVMKFELGKVGVFDPRHAEPRFFAFTHGAGDSELYWERFLNDQLIIGNQSKTVGNISSFSHDVLGHLSAYIEFPELVEFIKDRVLETQVLERGFAKSYPKRFSMLKERNYYLIEGLVIPKTNYKDILGSKDILPEELVSKLDRPFTQAEISKWAEDISEDNAKNFFVTYIENYYRLFHLMGGSARDTFSGMNHYDLHHLNLFMIEQLNTGRPTKFTEKILTHESWWRKENKESIEHFPLLQAQSISIDPQEFDIFVSGQGFGKVENKVALLKMSILMHRMAQLSLYDWFTNTGVRYTQSSKLWTLLCRDPIVPLGSRFYAAFCSKKAFGLE